MSALADFLLARIAEDAARAANGFPHPEALSESTHRRDVAEKIHAVTLGFACPTCHAGQGHPCVAMTPPTRAPKPASDFHATRRDLARADYRRQYGGLSLWNQARVLSESIAKKYVVTLLEAEGNECALGLLGFPYRDHPDWRNEWCP